MANLSSPYCPFFFCFVLVFFNQMVVRRKGIILRNLETVNSLTLEQCTGQ